MHAQVVLFFELISIVSSSHMVERYFIRQYEYKGNTTAPIMEYERMTRLQCLSECILYYCLGFAVNGHICEMYHETDIEPVFQKKWILYVLGM